MKVLTGVKVVLAAAVTAAGLVAYTDDWIPLGPETATVLRAGDPIYQISTSGYYYLTNDVKHIRIRPAEVSKGMTMDTIDVTVDLRGHSISNVSDRNFRLFECGQSDDLSVLTYCTLTNSAETTSYLDGRRHKFAGKGRGILNHYTGVMHLGGNIVIRRCVITDYPSDYTGNKDWFGAGICNHGTFYMTGGAVGDAETAVNGVCNSTKGVHGGGIFTGQEQVETRPCARQTKFYMIGGSVQYCKSGKHGGGISNQFWDSLLVVGGEGEGVTISHNTSPSGAGVMTGNTSTLYLTNNVEISYNEATGTTEPRDRCSGGGISVGYGGDVYGGGTNQLFIFNCNIVSNNAASLGGGGIYMRGVFSGRGKIEMHGGRIAYNKTTGVGGGIHTQGPVLLTGGVIEENTSDSNGGGLCIDVDSGNEDDWVQAFTMEGGCIRNNSATQGAGVYTVNEVNISGGTISNNHATVRGGGVCIDQPSQGGKGANKPFKLTGGRIANNIADGNGGGFAVILDDKGDVRLENGDVCDNRAGGNGGGFWFKGEMKENVVTLVGGSVSGNVATDGGGLYMTNLSINATGGNIVNNSAVRGGGMCLSVNSSATFSGTVDISHNVATNIGGAVAMNASAQLTINSGTFTDNEAQMGGGVHLVKGATMTYNGGTMTGNRAVVRAGVDASQETAWHTGINDLNPGVGGAVYVGAGDSSARTFFSCPGINGLVSIFENTAEKAGNDIVASGLNTKLDLPDAVISNDVYRLTWYEDYYTDDNQYDKPNGTKEKESIQVKRYADADGKPIAVIPADAEVAGTYWCLTLGYGFHGIPPALWITDHADAGKDHVHLQFQPDFQGELPVSLDYWARLMNRDNRIFTEWMSPDGTTTNAVQATLRAGFEACADGRIWITTPVPAGASEEAPRRCQIRINRAGE